jgi:hypothetical protein
MALKRLPRAHSRFDEHYIQELLVRNPELLPVEALREDAGHLLCIGREVKCAAGAIDNLYLSTGGYPVVVETKLWRNPQARREVLSQVLDYTKELVEKDFEWLEKQWATFCSERKRKAVPLLEVLQELSDDTIDEARYVDRVNGALNRGDIVSLIVGDGIKTGLQKLVSHLCRDSAHLRYSLALVELACYEQEGKQKTKPLLVVPQVIQSVEPIQRAYVKVEAPADSNLKIRSVVEDEKPVKTGYKRSTLTEEELVADLEKAIGEEKTARVKYFYDDLLENLELEGLFRAAALMIKIPDPANEKPGASLLAIERNGGIYNPRFLLKQLMRMGVDQRTAESISSEYWESLNKIDKRFDPNGMKHKKKKLFVPIPDLIPKFNRIRKAVERAADQVNHYFDESS